MTELPSDEWRSPFEALIHGQRTFLERGNFQLNTGPVPGLEPVGRWRMRDFGPVHVTTYGNLLSIATFIEIVPSSEGGPASIGGDLEYVRSEEHRRMIIKLRGWSDE